MNANEILDLLAHPRFLRLESMPGGWKIAFKSGEHTLDLRDGTLDRLMDRFASAMEPTPSEDEILAALDFGKTAEQHLVGGSMYWRA